MLKKIAIKRELRRLFPAYRFSVSVDSMRIKVVVCSGPSSFESLLHGSTHTDINLYHIPDYEKHSEFLTKVLNIIMTGNAHTTQSLYSYPNHVIIKIGDWNKPYKIKEHKMNLFTRAYTFVVGMIAMLSLCAATLQAASYSLMLKLGFGALTVASLFVFCAYLYFDKFIHAHEDQ